MNHPHNKDECRIQRSGRWNICSLALQNLCPEVKNKNKNLYLILSKQNIRFLLGWHDYVFMRVWNGCAAFKSQIPEGFYNCSMHPPKFTGKKKWRNNTCMSDIIHPRVYTTLDAQAPLELVNNWWRSSSANSSGLIRGRMRLFDLEVWPHHCMIKYTLPGLMRRSLLSVLSRTECH